MSGLNNLVDHLGRPLSSSQVKEAIRPKTGSAPLRQLEIHEQARVCSFEAARAQNVAQGALLNKIYAKTPQGQIEAVFFYKDCFYTADVDIAQKPGSKEIQVTGVTILCPKCDCTLLLNNDATLHWEGYEVQLPDALWRPLLSIDGTFGCTYSASEASGVGQPRSKGVKRTACGFMGGIHLGQCREHRIGAGKSRPV